MTTVWMLRQNPYGDKTNGTNQIEVESFIKQTKYITCPFGHIEKTYTNHQYINFMTKIKKNDIVLIPLKGKKKYIKAIIEDDEVLRNQYTEYFYLADDKSISLSKERGFIRFTPHVRKIKQIQLCDAMFDMRKFPRCTFCEMRNGEPS